MPTSRNSTLSAASRAWLNGLRDSNTVTGFPTQTTTSTVAPDPRLSGNNVMLTFDDAIDRARESVTQWRLRDVVRNVRPVQTLEEEMALQPATAAPPPPPTPVQPAISRPIPVRTSDGNWRWEFTDSVTTRQPEENEEMEFSIKKRGSGDENLTKTEQFLKPVGYCFSKKGYVTASAKEPYVALELENELRGLDNTNAEVHVSMPDSIGSFMFHAEGSLRYLGLEYVQAKPKEASKTLADVKELLDNLDTLATQTKCYYTNSLRTSVHLHLDATRLDIRQVALISCVYWMLEEFLSEFCGDNRKGNLFCIRSQDSNFLQQHLASTLINREYSAHMVSNGYRYASLNMSSLAKFGSLEFRLMRGTNKYSDIETWVRVIQAIHDFAIKKLGSLEAFREYFDKTPAEDIPEDIFGKELFSTLNKYSKIHNLGQSIRNGYMNVHQVLNSRKDFSYKEEITKEREVLEKKIADAARKKAEQERRNAEEERLVEQTRELSSRWSISPAVLGDDAFEGPVDESLSEGDTADILFQNIQLLTDH